MTAAPTSSEPLYRLPVRLLGDLVSPRALERILQDAAQARGQTPETLDAPTLEDILKREVFKRLQLSVPAALAKRRVSDVIKELLEATPAPPMQASGEQSLGVLEEGARRFTLYFDWPETQRLRGVLGVARQQQQAGQDITALIREGQDLITLMERRLQEGLVTQAQDLAELQAAFRRVQGMGGKDVRRLESLIAQIEEAQGQSVLLPAEVERARNITFTLRKLLESSVVQPLESSEAPAPLDPEAQARVLALEQEHVARQLADLAREFGPVVRARPELEERVHALRAEHASGTVKAETVNAWRAELEAVRDAVLAAQREELVGIEARLTTLPDSPELTEARTALDVARLTLAGGGLATDELRDLGGTLAALEAAPALAARLLAGQRELSEVERAAREVPGASDDLAPHLAAAREALGRGEDVEIDALWAALERRMGEAAQQRQDFDARAYHVIREYDTVRHLAGETTQKLGRLADALRAQRRLGPMSADARERYAQSLEGAEALLAEARAEYQAAQEVTASFGADALSGLLDVFDFGGGTGGDLFGTAAPAEQTPESSDLPDDTWLIRGSTVTAGRPDPAVPGVAALLEQATLLDVRVLRFEDAQGAWAARQDGAGGWRLARGPNAAFLEDRVGDWLATGEVRR
ncbi:hypothetical protein E5F05_05940 [Deinococcus metallilatus]|uniref:Uncharacterized protein n=1 Tax=Deinococcus metallilatus TaxID=1211322 RepID=A0AAJ5FA44_9DEIO|nr:hypothetical protein [Deinococcus metallilatus]MBB5294478.1 hypothetical protein [Deinococcus metallilatus]QBY07532.1 hypothetical protein E5F05_05940 [Deinococcus metallilatus]RXJ13948.1 hypothetical protein ERJ73_04775 [Deinococcus metallilatus]TLK29913.1 hypothetical protein FCS05_05090 [Deinococcus metallilatus]GMA15694.1 hypothetical protein GCM10025871_20250 [Deinococcus metallilatus]